MPAAPRHLTALTRDGELLEAPRLQELCARDRGHPDARRAIEAGRERALTAAVCGTPVRCQFGAVLGWHFAHHPDGEPCAHADETAEHLEAVDGLREALSRTLSDSWTLFERRRLKNGRTPDLLAVRRDRRVAVAFLVQRHPLAEAAWLERRADYRRAGVRDYWLLCDRAPRGGRPKPPEEDRSVLARAVFGAPDQRPLYLGWFGDEALHVRERLYSYRQPDPLRKAQSYRKLCRTADEIPPTPSTWPPAGPPTASASSPSRPTAS